MVTRKTKDFPRDFKYSLGDKLRNECIELVIFIYKANTLRQQRKEHLQQILERVQVIELMLRLSRDLRLFNVAAFSEIVLLTDSLARQAQGWITHTPDLRAD
jgi:hypothetical protein